MNEGYSIGEVAARTGVSVRALRLYEAAGLIRPLRTEAGRRAYRTSDLAAVHRIVVLKQAGFTLAQIGGMLAERSLDPARLIDVQIRALEERSQVLDRMLEALKSARRRLTDGIPLSPASLCDLIQCGVTMMTEENWQSVFDRYYTPEEQERWKAAKAAFPADPTDYTKAWSALIARVEAAIAAGAAPDSEAAMQLARDWFDLQRPLVDAVGVETWNKSARMYGEMDSWQTETVKAPFSAVVYAFVLAAVAAARDRGTIPPRA